MCSSFRLCAFSVCALFILSACGAKEDSAESTAAPAKTVLDPLLQQRDRVQQRVDQLPQERKADLDKAMESDSR